MKRLRDESGHASVIPALRMPSLFGSVPLAPHGVREQGMARRATGRAVVAGAAGPIFDRWLQRLLRNQGQALIEYALMAGFVAVAAGAIMPNVSASISTIFSKIGSVMTAAAAS